MFIGSSFLAENPPAVHTKSGQANIKIPYAACDDAVRVIGLYERTNVTCSSGPGKYFNQTLWYNGETTKQDGKRIYRKCVFM